MPLDIAKTLKTTRDVLFTRYAIKRVLIPVCKRNRKFFHPFLFILGLVHFRTVGIFLCFLYRWYNAICSTYRHHCVCPRSLKDTQIYYIFEMLLEFTSKRKPFHYNRTGGGNYSLRQTFVKAGIHWEMCFIKYVFNGVSGYFMKHKLMYHETHCYIS